MIIIAIIKITDGITLPSTIGRIDTEVVVVVVYVI